MSTQQIIPDAGVRESAEAYCQQLIPYIEDVAQLLLGSQPHASTDVFMADYLSSVVSGQHVLWRHYEYVAATPHNRQIFLATARRSLAATGQAGHLSIEDIHSLLLLLCPDFPLVTVKNAWTPAVNIQAWHDKGSHRQHLGRQPHQQQQQQQQPVSSPAGGPLVQLSVFLQCLEVTFTYEQYLMYIRKTAFTQDKKCLGLQQLDAAMQSAAQQLSAMEWPVPLPEHMKSAVMQASRAGVVTDFHFRDLIKALCCDEGVVLHVRRQLMSAMAAAAAAAAANNQALVAERSTNSSDDGREADNDHTALLAVTAAAESAVSKQYHTEPGRNITSAGGCSTASSSSRPWK